MKRKITTVDSFKRKKILFDDRRYLVKSSDYLPYEIKIAEMLALGEVNKEFFADKAKSLLSSLNDDDNMSILNVKGVDGYDIDTHFNRIRQVVFNTHKKALGEYKEATSKATEDYYKKKYSGKADDVKNNSEQ